MGLGVTLLRLFCIGSGTFPILVILLSVVHLVSTIMHAVSSKKRCSLFTRQMYQTTGECAPY